MSEALESSSDALLERRGEPAGRDWMAIGIGLAAAFALIAIYLAGLWAIWIVADALF